MNISILIPVFNEEQTVGITMRKVLQITDTGIIKEIIIIDDGSTDASLLEIEKVRRKNKGIKVISHDKNLGKGAAIRTGIKHAKGDYIIIQDADEEYNPKDILKLTKGLAGKDSVVFGTRLKRLPHLKKEEKQWVFLIHFFGNRFLSLVVSILYGQWLTDIETGYKLIPRKTIQSLNLTSNGFDFEAEVTSKLLKQGFRIKEIPITTIPRDYKHGKKLKTIPDGLKAFWAILKYRWRD